MIAKDPEVAATLIENMQKESTHMLYQAILRGPMKEDETLWDWKLTDKAEGRKNPQGLSKDRKECETRVKVLQKNDYLTLVECEITNGRQHQIRKHAAVAEHPVVGDNRYNDPKYNERLAKRFGTERLFLHATELRIKLNGRDLVFTSPLPADFKNLMKSN
jgi:tRNA pseudouridine65 synthase